MSKKIFVVSILAGLLIQNSANASFLSHGLNMKLHASKHQIAPKLKASEDYVDFSGEWVGSCDDSEDSEILKISVTPDLSAIYVDNESLSIDGINTKNEKTNTLVEENNLHLHWSKEGDALIGTLLGYFKDTNLALSGLTSWVGKMNIFMENDKLNMEYNVSIFLDGEFQESFQSKCTYSRK